MGLFSMFGGGSSGAAGTMADYAKQAAAEMQKYLQKSYDKQEAAFGNGAAYLQNAAVEGSNQLNPYAYGGLKAFDALNQSQGLGNITSSTQFTPDQLNNLYGAAVKFLQEDNFGKGSGIVIDPNNPLKTIQLAANQAMSSGAMTDRTYDHSSGVNLLQMFNNLGGQAGGNIDQFAFQNNLQGWKIDPATGKTIPTSLTPVNNNSQNGQGALNGFVNSGFAQLAGGYDPSKSLAANFQTSPGYQFQLDQGLNALQKSAAARGLLESGSLLKEMNNYGQGVANQDFNNYVNRMTGAYQNYQGALANLSNMGLNSANSLANISQNRGQNIAAMQQTNADRATNIYTMMGQNAANSLLAQGSALAQGQAMDASSGAQLGSYLGGALGKQFLGSSLGAAAGPVGSVAGSLLAGLF